MARDISDLTDSNLQVVLRWLQEEHHANVMKDIAKEAKHHYSKAQFHSETIHLGGKLAALDLCIKQVEGVINGRTTSERGNDGRAVRG